MNFQKSSPWQATVPAKRLRVQGSLLYAKLLAQLVLVIVLARGHGYDAGERNEESTGG